MTVSLFFTNTLKGQAELLIAGQQSSEDWNRVLVFCLYENYSIVWCHAQMLLNWTSLLCRVLKRSNSPNLTICLKLWNLYRWPVSPLHEGTQAPWQLQLQFSVLLTKAKMLNTLHEWVQRLSKSSLVKLENKQIEMLFLKKLFTQVLYNLKGTWKLTVLSLAYMLTRCIVVAPSFYFT